MELVSTLAQHGPFTKADLDAMPDDGRRHELLDGTLIVTPAPADRHQAVVVNLIVLLKQAASAELRVRTAPYDVTLAEDTIVQPDVLLARKRDITDSGLPAAPVLAVEVLSPSTRLVDLNLKRARYEEAGIPHYWVVDPDAPTLVAFELRGGAYVELARVGGSDIFEVTSPVAIRFRPGDLVD